jgi:hypothetical protein
MGGRGKDIFGASLAFGLLDSQIDGRDYFLFINLKLNKEK